MSEPTTPSGWDGLRARLAVGLTLLMVFVLPGAAVLAGLGLVLQGRVRGIDVGLFGGMFLLTGLGVTVGYHRLATHRSFQTHPAIKALFLILGSMAFQGTVRTWMAIHLQHHAHADQRDDPHSPTQGLLHSHWGWLFRLPVSDTSPPLALLDGPTVWVSRTFVVWVILGYLIPFLIGGWEGLLWGGLVRQFAVQNVTFAVNSICHRYGSRRFPTRDLSTNHWGVGWLGLGEGWHNNHHAFPSSAFHGLRWWEFDLSGQVIRALQALGLAWQVQRPTPAQIQARATHRVSA